MFCPECRRPFIRNFADTRIHLVDSDPAGDIQRSSGQGVSGGHSPGTYLVPARITGIIRSFFKLCFYEKKKEGSEWFQDLFGFTVDLTVGL